jgi:hypothetical protein
MYGADSLLAVSKEPSKYKLSLGGVQEGRWRLLALNHISLFLMIMPQQEIKLMM